MTSVNDTSYEDTLRYCVVRNDEEQYSIWPADRELPSGWSHCGFEGSRQECLDHVDEVWTDMRPRSVRQYLAELEASGVLDQEPPEEEEGYDNLVDRLVAEQDVEVRQRPECTPGTLKAAIDRGYVHVAFTETKGGTELGVELDRAATDLSEADFDNGTGTVTITGDLTLDFQPVRCRARIDLTTMRGRGCLVRRDP